MPTPAQITAANELFRIATTTTVAQRDSIRQQITAFQQQMGLSTELSDGKIGRGTARAIFDLTGRRIPGIDVTSVPSPTLTPPSDAGTSTPAAPPAAPPPAPDRSSAESTLAGNFSQVGGAVVSAAEDTRSFFERNKTVLIITGGLLVATGIGVFLMSTGKGEAAAMDEASARQAARMLGISVDSDAQSIRAAAARAMQAYADDSARRAAIAEARDILIRRAASRSSGAINMPIRGHGDMSYSVSSGAIDMPIRGHGDMSYSVSSGAIDMPIRGHGDMSYSVSSASDRSRMRRR